MFTFLLVVHAIIAASLVAVILMQRSEGGGLGIGGGGSPTGLISARGAADLLTRATTVLATVFVVMSIGLAAYASMERAPREMDTSLERTAPAATDIPMEDAAPDGNAAPAAEKPAQAPASAPGDAVPLAQ